jgi:O-antigen ligase
MAQPFNLFIGVAAEQGLVGILALLMVGVALLRSIVINIRGPNRQAFVVFGATVGALFMYSLSQSFLLANSSIATACFAFLGTVARLDAHVDK